MIKTVGGGFLRFGKILLRFAGIPGLIISAILLLIEGFKWAYNNVEWFREAVDLVVQWFRNLPQYFGQWVENIKNIFSGAWDSLSQSFQDAIDTINRLWEGFIEWINGIPEWWSGIWASLGERFAGFRDNLGNIVNSVINFFIGPNSFIGILLRLPQIVADMVITLIDRFREWRDSLGGIIGRIVNFFVGPGSLVDKLLSVPRFVAEMVSGVVGFFLTLKDGVVEQVKGIISWLFDGEGSLLGKIRGLPGKIAEALQNLGNIIGEKIVSGLNTLFGWINDKIIGNLQKVLDFFNISATISPLPTLRWNGYAEGGAVRGPGGPRDDKIPAKLSNGEYVVKTASARRIGKSNLDYINKHGELPQGGGISLNPVDWIKAGASALGEVASWIGGKTIGPALEFAVDSMLKLLPESYKNANFLTQFVVGALEKLKDVAESWGAKKEEEAESSANYNFKGLGKGPFFRPLSSYNIGRGSASHGYSAVDLGADGGKLIYAIADGVITTVRRLDHLLRLVSDRCSPRRVPVAVRAPERVHQDERSSQGWDRDR